MGTRKTTPPHTHKESERERYGGKGRGTNKVFVSERATELKIVGEGVRERENRSPGEGEVVFYASKTDINHVSI